MKIRAIATLLFILFSISAFGQGRAKISGYIRDADGNPLDLVNIRVKKKATTRFRLLPVTR